MSQEGHPTTEATLHVLVDRDRMPAISATASIVQGSETMFARLEVDDMPADRARHAVRFALSGRRVDVLRVLDQLRAAVIAAPVPLAGNEEGS
jgi:hypothetical protein